MKQFEIETILNAVTISLNIDIIKQHKSHKRKIVDARRVYTLLAKKYTTLGLAAIGTKIGKDHSSVIHYEKTGTQFLETDKEFLQIFKDCEQYLTNSYYDYRKKKLLANFTQFKDDFKTVKTPFLLHVDDILKAAHLN